ncbi:hypothetical protein [Cobetia crustatorum]|uniref:hypothetical protein n=1 Tax=Cobetia crustatorum TaxID=553385 RepID=UPI0012EBC57C|nr:hypothetical protein [Cobetia crustatorum]
MNKSLILYQLALVYAKDNKYHEAINLFERCFLNSKAGIDEIFHPRNNYFLRMYSDCEMLLKLSRHSSIAMNRLAGKVDSRSGTRFTMFAGSESAKINALLPLKRFNQEIIPKDNWFKSCQMKLNGSI